MYWLSEGLLVAMRWRLAVLLVGFGLVAAGCSGNDGSGGLGSDAANASESGAAWSIEEQAALWDETDRRLDLSPVLQRFLDDHSPYSIYGMYRSQEERNQAEIEHRRRILESEGSERARLLFEEDLRVVIFVAQEVMPTDVQRADDALRSGYYDGLAACSDALEYDIRFFEVIDSGEWSAISSEEGDEYRRLYGLSLADYFDLRYECGRFARTYPTMASSERNALIEQVNDYYQGVLLTWIEQNDDRVVLPVNESGDAG